MKVRLDRMLVEKGLVPTRSQAENYVRLGRVTVNGQTVTKPGFKVVDSDNIKFAVTEQYVSRAALKLASVADALKLDFKGKTVLDVGSSTGGFTDFALRNGAVKVIAVDVGTDQLHPSLRDDSRIELHEKTDIRTLKLTTIPDVVVIDVSFISLREILPAVSKLASPETAVVAMAKPQFEAGDNTKHKGVIKNDKLRREVLRGFEEWTKKLFKIIDKADSSVAGAKGNQERFYLLKKLK